MNKRNRKNSRKSRDEEGRRHHRVKSAYINNKILLYIVPTVRDNRTLLHAYPINDMHNHNTCHQMNHQMNYQMSHQMGHQMSHQMGHQMNHQMSHQTNHQEKFDPRYVKKLEYSSDKLKVDHRNLSRSKESKYYKDSGNKKDKHRSMELDARGRQFFDTVRHTQIEDSGVPNISKNKYPKANAHSNPHRKTNNFHNIYNRKNAHSGK
jgi:hypothetical protein